MNKIFEELFQQATEAEARASKKFNSLAMWRLVSFFGVALAMASWRFYDQNLLLLLALALLIVFLYLLGKQQKARREREFQRNIKEINKDELGRLRLEFTKDDTGGRFADASHPYASDLDIFGNHSLYRLLDRTATSEGAGMLAGWLKQRAELHEILRRQEAVNTSSGNVSWRQQWLATALLYKQAANEVGSLKAWVKQPPFTDLGGQLLWRFWPIVVIILGITWLVKLLPAWPFFLSLLWCFLLLRRVAKNVENLTEKTVSLGRTMQAYAALAHLAEHAPFEDKFWKLPKENRAASQELRSLGNWFDRLDLRENVYFQITVGTPLLWDYQCLYAIGQWKAKNAPFLEGWLQHIAEIEAINSLSGFAYANPTYVVPQVLWHDQPSLHSLRLGHPLIPEATRIPNDFSIEGRGQAMLITGSNMSGKSTFLRTVGINLVLAQAGAVACAEEFITSAIQVFTSMRVADSLEENTSSFYAELKRISDLLKRTERANEIPVIYLLDEILKGTNSEDRHKGAEALISQLHHTNSLGIVSTHDLALGTWGEGQSFVQNLHFTSDIENGRITFDYRLRSGICQSFNAVALMRLMGLKVEDNTSEKADTH